MNNRNIKKQSGKSHNKTDKIKISIINYRKLKKYDSVNKGAYYQPKKVQ